MAISPHATWTTQSEKLNGRPVYLVSQEYDYLTAKASTDAELKAGSGADSITKSGSVICSKATDDILNSSTYTDRTWTPIYNTQTENYQRYM